MQTFRDFGNPRLHLVDLLIAQGFSVPPLKKLSGGQRLRSTLTLGASVGCDRPKYFGTGARVRCHRTHETHFCTYLLSDAHPQSTLPTVLAIPSTLSSKAPSFLEKPASVEQLGKYTKGTMKPAVN